MAFRVILFVPNDLFKTVIRTCYFMSMSTKALLLIKRRYLKISKIKMKLK